MLGLAVLLCLCENVATFLCSHNVSTCNIEFESVYYLQYIIQSSSIMVDEKTTYLKYNVHAETEKSRLPMTDRIMFM